MPMVGTTVFTFLHNTYSSQGCVASSLDSCGSCHETCGPNGGYSIRPASGVELVHWAQQKEGASTTRAVGPGGVTTVVAFAGDSGIEWYE